MLCVCVRISAYREKYGHLEWSQVSTDAAPRQSIAAVDGESVPLMVGTHRAAVTAMVHTEAIQYDDGA